MKLQGLLASCKVRTLTRLYYSMIKMVSYPSDTPIVSACRKWAGSVIKPPNNFTISVFSMYFKVQTSLCKQTSRDHTSSVYILGQAPLFWKGSSRKPVLASLRLDAKQSRMLRSAKPDLSTGLPPLPRRLPSFYELGAIPPHYTALPEGTGLSGRCFLPALFPLSLISVYATFSSRCHFRVGAGRGEEEEEEQRRQQQQPAFWFPLSHRMAGPAINIRLHNTKREPAGFCQRPPEPPSPMRGGREEAGTALPTAPRAPAVGGAPGQPTDPQTSTAPPPQQGGVACGTEPGGARPCWGNVPEGPRAPQGAPPPPGTRPERAPRQAAHGARPQRRSGAPGAAPPPPAARCEAPETSRRKELRGRAAGPSPRGSPPF